jgi:hypothetical protein
MVRGDGEVYHVVVARITFDMTAQEDDGTLHFAAKQAPLVTEDAWQGQPNQSSPLWESDFAPYKPKCDVIVANATAYAPSGRDTQSWSVAVGLNSWRKDITVTGPRSFASFGRITAPKAVKEVPLDYGLAYGGQRKYPENAPDDQLELWDTDERNPIGLGFGHSFSKRQPSNRAAPQVEPNDKSFTGQKGYPVVGLGCLGRAWLPRRPLAGTYDTQWQNEQWPLPPLDHDFAYWNCAPADQQIAHPPPRSQLWLSNIYPGKPYWSGFIPRHEMHTWIRIAATAEHGPVIVPKPFLLDTLILDMKTLQLSAVYRCVTSSEGGVGGIDVRMTQIYKPE